MKEVILGLLFVLGVFVAGFALGYADSREDLNSAKSEITSLRQNDEVLRGILTKAIDTAFLNDGTIKKLNQTIKVLQAENQSLQSLVKRSNQTAQEANGTSEKCISILWGRTSIGLTKPQN